MVASSGAQSRIFVEIDRVMASLAGLAADMEGFPRPADVATHHGPTGGVVDSFATALAAATRRASKAADMAQQELLGMDQTIRDVLKELTASDSGALEAAAELTHALEVAEYQQESVAAPAPVSAGAQSSAQSTSSAFDA